MAWIGIEEMEFFAYHGHFDEEQTIGNRFIVDFYFKSKTSKAELSDELKDTVDYSKVYLLIQEEMQETSKLVEHIGRRIIDRIHREFPEIEKMRLKIRKMNPPVGNKVESVSITFRKKYKTNKSGV